MTDEPQTRPNAKPAPRGLLCHLHFAWLMVWTTLFILPLGSMQVLSHAISPTAKNFRRWAGLWSRLCLLFGFIRIRTVQHKPLDSSRPYVFVSNHQTGLDIWSNVVAIRQPFGFVAKESLRKVPILGLALRYSACLFVDRSTARKAVQSIAEAAQRIREGNSVLIYPEGRRTWSPQTDEFLKGAFQLAIKARVPIVPVALMNTYELYDERAKASRPGRIDVVVGSPIETVDMVGSDIPDVMNATRAWIQDCVDRYHLGLAPPFKTALGAVSSPVH